MVLGEALGAQGDAKGSAEAMQRARLVARATKLEDLFGAEQPAAAPVFQGDTALGPKAPAKRPVKAPAKKP